MVKKSMAPLAAEAAESALAGTCLEESSLASAEELIGMDEDDDRDSVVLYERMDTKS